jgi:hypothetical protein
MTKPVTLCVQCPDYHGMREAILEGRRRFQAGLAGQLQGDPSAKAVREHGAALWQDAMKRAHEHKGKCLLCSNTKAADSSRTFAKFGIKLTGPALGLKRKCLRCANIQAAGGQSV